MCGIVLHVSCSKYQSGCRQMYCRQSRGEMYTWSIVQCAKVQVSKTEEHEGSTVIWYG